MNDRDYRTDWCLAPSKNESNQTQTQRASGELYKMEAGEDTEQAVCRRGNKGLLKGLLTKAFNQL